MIELFLNDLETQFKDNKDIEFVFLGRDGIGMYEAYRAMSLGTKLDSKNNELVNEESMSSNISTRPYHYLVLNTLMATNSKPEKIIKIITAQLKDEESKIIDKIENGKIQFIDTGYNGTIPRKIIEAINEMYNKSLKFEDNTILMSALDPDLLTNKRSSYNIDTIVEYEMGKKPEGTMLGWIDESSSYISNNISEEDKTIFLRLIRKRIRKHFFTKKFNNEDILFKYITQSKSPDLSLFSSLGLYTEKIYKKLLEEGKYRLLLNFNHLFKDYYNHEEIISLIEKQKK